MSSVSCASATAASNTDPLYDGLADMFRRFRTLYCDGQNLYPNRVVEYGWAKHRDAVAQLARDLGWTVHYQCVMGPVLGGREAAFSSSGTRLRLEFEACYMPDADVETF